MKRGIARELATVLIAAATGALMTVAMPVAFGQGATAPAVPAFAASVIKPSGPASGNGLSVKFLPGGRLVARNANVRLLIKIAYNLNDDEVTGGPAWIGLKHFDIDATTDAAVDSSGMVDKERNHLLLQGLLQDRFQLRLRSEMRQMSTYALVVAKGGPKMTLSATQDGDAHILGGLGHITAANASLDQLAAAVEDWVGHPVKNLTGLDGKYDFKLEWTPDQAMVAGGAGGGAATDPADYSGPTIFTAVQQQLGLSLEARKTDSLCEVVESVELPSEN
jgi:uncharacterized protein (TIGR03435 family)